MEISFSFIIFILLALFFNMAALKNFFYKMPKIKGQFWYFFNNKIAK